MARRDSSRIEALLELVRRCEWSPFSLGEWVRLWQQVAAAEREVARLGERAAAEREDVVWLENPAVRLVYWMRGDLEDRETRERSEYARAMAELMERGSELTQQRQWLAQLDSEDRVSDGEAFEALRHVTEAEVSAHFGPELLPAHRRAESAERCVVASRFIGLHLEARVRGEGLERTLRGLAGDLRAEGLEPLAIRLEAALDADDSAELRRTAEGLEERARLRTAGLAQDVREVVRARFLS